MLELGTLNKIQSKEHIAFFRIGIKSHSNDLQEWFFNDSQIDTLKNDLQEFLIYVANGMGYDYERVATFKGDKGLTLIKDDKKFFMCFMIRSTNNFIKVDCSKEFEKILIEFRDLIKDQYNFKKVA